MIKKILAVLLIGVMICSLTACGDASSNKPVIIDEPSTSEQPDEPSEPDILPESSETSEPESTGSYSNKVYYVGEDIPAGGYVINCTSADYGLEVIVFASPENYKAFQNAEKFTIGEFSTAVELHAWANFYLEQEENAYVGLRAGYIILLDDGQCEFSKYEPSASQTMFSGIYVVGEDINAGKIDIKCTSDYLQVTLFESREKYLEYHKASRFTIGEESDAIDAFSESTDFIYTDDSSYANLRDGMVVLVEEGVGEYLADEGPIINNAP